MMWRSHQTALLSSQLHLPGPGAARWWRCGIAGQSRGANGHRPAQPV